MHLVNHDGKRSCAKNKIGHFKVNKGAYEILPN